MWHSAVLYQDQSMAKEGAPSHEVIFIQREQTAAILWSTKFRSNYTYDTSICAAQTPDENMESNAGTKTLGESLSAL